MKPAELEDSEVVNSAYDPSQVKDAIVAPELVYDIPTILFDFDASQLGASAKSILDEVSEFLQKNQSVKLLVIGHTDRIGASSYNQRLSIRRAQSVRDYLLSKNIATQRLRILGQGENKLKHPCTSCTQEQHRENRRVEMEIMSKEN
ncbi:MAG: OmpA family protein [Flavobacteriaceae bacterium]|nr:OmpA family protein [Flavobacteriaceae bacterium]